MENLEKNYGVFLEIDDFIKEMKQKLNEIKSFKGLYEYIGSDFGKDKTELTLIIEGYERAKKKGYIRENNNNKFRRYNNLNYNNNQAFREINNGWARGGIRNRVDNNNEYYFRRNVDFDDD